MAYIRVAYRTQDRDFDYVPGHRLNRLIVLEEISHFFRPSEKRWVNVKLDAIREAERKPYPGPDRRKDGADLWGGSERGNPALNEGPKDTNWLESLWRQVEMS